MAERWQQWMPFHIDRFRGSPDVQAMHPAARWGFLSLLASQWQTEDCTISPDPLDLASASGLGDELWMLYGSRILRKFPPIDIGGRLQNDVCFGEWQAAKNVFERNQMTPEELADLSEKRRKAGILGNEKRWGNRKVATKPSQSDRKCDKSDGKTIASDRLTGTGTLTSTEEQSTLALTSIEVPAGVFELPLPGQQGEWGVPQKLYDEMVRAYPGVDVMQQLSKMRAWLVSNPTNRKTPRGLPAFMNKWLGKEQDKTGGFNGRGNAATERAQRNHDILQRTVESGAERRVAGNRSADQPRPTSQPRPSGEHGRFHRSFGEPDERTVDSFMLPGGERE